jgi:hypothetical protein
MLDKAPFGKLQNKDKKNYEISYWTILKTYHTEQNTSIEKIHNFGSHAVMIPNISS